VRAHSSTNPIENGPGCDSLAAIETQPTGVVSSEGAAVTVVYIVFPLALVLSSLAVVAFIWAVRRGQLDDTVTPPVRILLDEPQASHGNPAADRDEGADRPPSEGPDSSPRTGVRTQPKSAR